jgi:Domain of unknown function (DUF4404)
MDPDLLRDQLTHLHEQLRDVRDVDPRSNQLLGEVQKDIQRLLEPPPAEGPHAAPGAASLAERLESIAVRFEVDHPTLAASSRRLIDLLGKVGL